MKLGDFGLACRLDTTGEIEEGESRYCAREVINADGAIDLRKADIFSLGASVYEIMLGRQLGAGGDHGSEEWHNIRCNSMLLLHQCVFPMYMAVIDNAYEN